MIKIVGKLVPYLKFRCPLCNYILESDDANNDFKHPDGDYVVYECPVCNMHLKASYDKFLKDYVLEEGKRIVEVKND